MTREEILAKYPNCTNNKTETLEEEHSDEQVGLDQQDLQQMHMNQPYHVVPLQTQGQANFLNNGDQPPQH